MAGKRASRTAWWGRWAAIAFFLAASVVVATPPATPAPGPAALQVLAVSAPQVLGQRPDLPVLGHGGQGRAAPDPAGYAWLPARAAITATTWWQPRRDGDGQQAQTGRNAHQVRGPPGRRATDALS